MSIKHTLKKTIAAAFVFAAAVFAGAGAEKVQAAENIAAGNLFIENFSVEGKNEEELKQVVEDKMYQFGQSIITINVGSQSMQVLAGELGIYQTNTDIVQRILNVGSKGNIWQKYNMQCYLEDCEPLIFEIELDVNEDILREIVEQRCTQLNVARRDMTLERGADGQLYPSTKVDGLYVDVDATTAKIAEYLRYDWHGGYGEINAVTIDDPAAGDAEKYSQITDVIGTGITTYIVDEDHAARNTNLAVGTSKINGIIVYPGEEFSALDRLLPFTEEAGYAKAGTYVDGEVVDDIGGGACQISSTLYRAVLEAELLVTERCEHSMIVGYVEPSMDAAVAEGIKDFKFINDTEYPVYIEGFAYDGVLQFNIYGHETRDPARSIGFTSEILEKDEDISTVFEMDDTVAVGNVSISDGHIGMRAVAYKHVYMNGEEVLKEQITYSRYKKSDTVVTVGTMGATASQLSQLSEAISDMNMAWIYSIVGYD